MLPSRPKGSKSKRKKLTGKDDKIARLLGGHRLMVAAYSKSQLGNYTRSPGRQTAAGASLVVG